VQNGLSSIWVVMYKVLGMFWVLTVVSWFLGHESHKQMVYVQFLPVDEQNKQKLWIYNELYLWFYLCYLSLLPANIRVLHIVSRFWVVTNGGSVKTDRSKLWWGSVADLSVDHQSPFWLLPRVESNLRSSALAQMWAEWREGILCARENMLYG